jgi:hypothetical protein
MTEEIQSRPISRRGTFCAKWRSSNANLRLPDNVCFEEREKWTMKQTSLSKLAIGISTVACAALLSFSWSEQRGVSLTVESAQARIGRPLTPFSVAGVARRQYRRAAYGYGAGVVGAGLAAGAIGAAAVAATSPYGYYGGGPYYYGGYGTGGYYGAYGGYPGSYYGAYAAGGYPGYYGGGYPGYYGGGYANRSYVTGRATLFPRYYSGGWGW